MILRCKRKANFSKTLCALGTGWGQEITRGSLGGGLGWWGSRTGKTIAPFLGFRTDLITN